MEYHAHIRQLPNGDREYQTAIAHLRGTAERAASCLSSVGLKNAAYLAGLLHDLGKCTGEFQRYLNGTSPGKRGSVIHTFQGCRYLLDRYHREDADYLQNVTAELLAFAIGAHHGLFDCVDAGHRIGLQYRREKQDTHQEEAEQNLFAQNVTEGEVARRFAAAVEEIDAFTEQMERNYQQDEEFCFEIGLLARLLLSAVIEGDRHDTISFMHGGAPSRWPEDMSPIWEERLLCMEKKLRLFPAERPVDKARHVISDQCKHFAQEPAGIYRLNVPTGSGKTLSCLRYALAHGARYHKKRLIFTSPLLSILEQNAKEIRKYIEDDRLILEHHSNVVQVGQSQDELDERELLVQSWDAPIIITTLVQLLSTMFDGSTTSIRRFQGLCDSVIVIDEVQTLPSKLLTMFNLAIEFLSEQCGATIVLCSATYPSLGSASHPLRTGPRDMVPYEKSLWDAFRRTELLRLEDMRLEKLPEQIRTQMEAAESLLVVCNKKDEAAYLLKETRSEKYHSFHLSASMCMEHRRNVIEALRESLENHERTLCISTQVIEAGVDISFQRVIRLTAGMDSVIQSAGRCNRNGESEALCPVYMVNCTDEKLGKLQDIQRGKTATIRLLTAFETDPGRFEQDLTSDGAVDYYYRSFYGEMNEGEQDFYVPQLGTTCFDLASCNRTYANEGCGRLERYALWQAFKTAGQYFAVFDENTVDVVVPYGKGNELIQELCSERCGYNPDYRAWVLRELGGYTVSLYQYQKNQLEKQHALIPVSGGTVMVLADGYYDEALGIITKQETQEFWEV